MASPLKQDLGNSLDLVDIQEIRDRVVILKDGSFRQVIMVGGINFSLKSEDEQNLVVQGYQTFLNSIDFSLQVLIHSRKVNIERYIQWLLDRRSNESSPILQNQIDEYIEFIKGFVQKNAIMEKVFLVVVPFFPKSVGPTVAGASGVFGGLFGKKKPDAAAETKTREEAAHVFHENLEQLGQRVAQVTSGLTGIGLEATILENEQLVELLYNFYNPQTIEKKEVPPEQK